MPRMLPVFPAFTLLVILLAAPAIASALTVRTIDDAAVDGAAPFAATSVCVLQPGPQATFHYVWTKPEELNIVAWRIPTASCAACASSGGLNVKGATIRVRWPFACTAQAQLSIVGATDVNGCLQPDTTQVLCSAPPATIRSTTLGVASLTHVLTLPAGCCISGNAFVMIRFTGFGACGTTDGTSPGLRASTQPCEPCQQYFMATNAVLTGLTEWCQPFGNEPGPDFLMWMAVDSDCCQVTPTGKHSWGRVKSIYR